MAKLSAKWRKSMELKLDYNNMMAEYVGAEQGFTVKDFADCFFHDNKVSVIFHNFPVSIPRLDLFQGHQALLSHPVQDIPHAVNLYLF